MRYLVIAYDNRSVTVNRIKAGERPLFSEEVLQDVLCQGSSFGDVVKALELAFADEMNARAGVEP